MYVHTYNTHTYITTPFLHAGNLHGQQTPASFPHIAEKWGI